MSVIPEPMTTENLETQLGSAVYDSHGQYFMELLVAGYDVDLYYDGGNGWGDVSKILAMVSVVRGATSYEDYEKFYNMVKRDYDGGLLSRRSFARLTGIKARPANQTARTRVYRQRQAQELQALRKATALKWIDENTDEAREYIDKITDENDTL